MYYVIRSVKPYLNTNDIITIYHSLFHVVMTCVITFWGNSTHSTQVFRMQKRAIRIIIGRCNRESFRNLSKELNILPLMSQYILSLLTLVSKNKEYYFANSEIHNINT
jgi:amino acid transporter